MVRFIEKETFDIVTFESWEEIIKLGGVIKAFESKNKNPKDFYNEKALIESIRLSISNIKLSEEEYNLRYLLITKL